MALYDSVYVDCPKCGKQNEVQTSAGKCVLRSYTIHSVPKVIAEALHCASHSCEKCAHKFFLSLLPDINVEMVVCSVGGQDG